MKNIISQISLIITSLIFGVALLALCGWIFEIENFILILPNSAPLNPLTALCFLLLASSILFKDKLSGYPSAVLGMLIVIAGSLRILEILHITSISPDLVFLRDTLLTYPDSVRMTQYTALSFILLGTIPITNLFSVVRRVHLAEIFSSLVFIISFLSIGAIFFENAKLITIPLFFSEAIHSVFFFLASSAIMYVLFRVKDENTFSFKNWFSIILVLIVFMILTGVVAGVLDQALNDQKIANYNVLVIVMLGIVISLLTTIIFSMLFGARDRAKAYADMVTKDLRTAKAHDEAVLSSLPDGLIATNKEGEIIIVNDVFTKLLGYEKDEVLGKKFSDAIEALDDSEKKIIKSQYLINKTLKKKSIMTANRNLLYRRKDGSVFPVSSTVSPIMLEHQVIGAVEIFRDITHEKAVDKAKTEFVSLASHQLRTPLSIVNWYVELLLSKDAGELNNEQKKYLEEIHIGNQRMTSLVNALLDVSKIELGMFYYEPELVNTVRIMKGVLHEQDLLIKERQLKVNLNFAENIPEILANEKLMWMVFQNLLSNAVKYTPRSGTVTFTMNVMKKGQKIDRVVLKKDSIYFAISDTGMGIPKGQVENVFTKLFRADNVKELDTLGSGLGLYIVKSIIERFGGQIWFDSEQNKGTTFYFVLPITGNTE